MKSKKKKRSKSLPKTNGLVVCFKQPIKDETLTSLISPELKGKQKSTWAAERLVDPAPKVEALLRSNRGIDRNSFGRTSTDIFYKLIYPDLPKHEKRLYNTFVIRSESKAEIDNLFAVLDTHPYTEYVQINRLNKTTLIPDDPYFTSGQLWNLVKINCPGGWDYAQGANTVVAVVDTGVKHNHADINLNMWQNAAGNYGYSFSDNTTDTMDYDGHGSHVAGIIAATINNTKGIVGVAPMAKIMAVRIFPNAYDDVCARAIYFAADNGANVINNSWGPADGRQESNPVVENAIEYAYLKGCVVVFAAGNDNDDVKYYSPANYNKVIPVSATNSSDNRASFSNYGNTLGAPGVSIWSLSRAAFPYTTMQGTSQAAPHVSGLAACMLGINRGLSPDQVSYIMDKSADVVTDVAKPIKLGRINAFNAIQQTLSTNIYTITIKAYGRVHDDDWGDPDEEEPYSFPDVISLLPGGPPAVRSWNKCVDNEVNFKIFLSFQMNEQRDVFVTGNLLLLEGTSCNGRQKDYKNLAPKWVYKNTYTPIVVYPSVLLTDKEPNWGTFTLEMNNPAP